MFRERTREISQGESLRHLFLDVAPIDRDTIQKIETYAQQRHSYQCRWYQWIGVPVVTGCELEWSHWNYYSEKCRRLRVASKCSVGRTEYHSDRNIVSPVLLIHHNQQNMMNYTWVCVLALYSSILFFIQPNTRPPFRWTGKSYCEPWRWNVFCWWRVVRIIVRNTLVLYVNPTFKMIW